VGAALAAPTTARQEPSRAPRTRTRGMGTTELLQIILRRKLLVASGLTLVGVICAYAI